MLEHQKLVISHLSHDKFLFKKELVKSLNWLSEYETTQLYHWVKQKYRCVHDDIIFDVFKTRIAC